MESKRHLGSEVAPTDDADPDEIVSIYTTAVENETPLTIAELLGCSAGDIVKLNARRYVNLKRVPDIDVTFTSLYIHAHTDTFQHTPYSSDYRAPGAWHSLPTGRVAICTSLSRPQTCTIARYPTLRKRSRLLTGTVLIYVDEPTGDATGAEKGEAGATVKVNLDPADAAGKGFPVLATLVSADLDPVSQAHTTHTSSAAASAVVNPTRAVVDQPQATVVDVAVVRSPTKPRQSAFTPFARSVRGSIIDEDS